MKIHNIRLDFATNSSSSHSFLELPDNTKVSTDTEVDFNWNFFTAHTPESKINYLAYCIKSNLRQIGISPKTQNAILSGIFDHLHQYDPSTTVDHQSVLTLPRTTDRKSINIEFLKDLAQYALKDNVVILGGNDNTESTHPLLETKGSKPSVLSELQTESDNDTLVATKNGDFWTLFNYKTGDKIKISFVETPKKELNKPELADIKITDYCPYSCPFCYQDSTDKGKHASLDDIRFIAKKLAEENVLEVALGGGEPTMHPQFLEILKIFSEHNIVPNFTTKNLTLLNQKMAPEILKYCGGIAFSVQNIDEMNKVKHSYNDSSAHNLINTQKYNYLNKRISKQAWDPSINFQFVLGTTNNNTFEKMLKKSKEFGHRIILLGYKENGRGSQFAPHDYSNWLNSIIKMKEEIHALPSISFDTAIAAEFKQQLAENKVPEETFHTKEGVFSIYIDATTMKFYPSSYTGLEKEKTFTENWLKDFQGMETEPTKMTQKTIKFI